MANLLAAGKCYSTVDAQYGRHKKPHTSGEMPNEENSGRYCMKCRGAVSSITPDDRSLSPAPPALLWLIYKPVNLAIIILPSVCTWYGHDMHYNQR